eukprot:TRINITY_DN9234_c0_g2_i1.p1 TRINITY_DN9234_c0_g2~~TRINITY_DN9234_c0_g2_i1.p1  ORF type:complete len:647 (+),score=157.05 TRINITY_DN9234_c0_g2_i1:143-2083(+)
MELPDKDSESDADIEESKDRLTISPNGVTEEIVYKARSRREKLSLIFLSYAEVMEESGASVMKLTPFVKLLTASKVLDESFNKTKAEILFKASTAKCQMDFNTFMTAMVRVGEAKYKEFPKDRAAEEVVTRHLLPLYSSLCKSDSQPLSALAKLVLDPDAKLVLNSVAETLLLVYKEYAGDGVDREGMRSVVKNVFTVLRDFDLLKSNALTKQGIVLMVYLLVNTAEESLTNVKGTEVLMDPRLKCGSVFTFGRFIVFLYWFALVGLDVWKQADQQYTPAEKVYYLLARMQFSKGLCKRQPRCIASLTPSPDTIKGIIRRNPCKDKPSLSINSAIEIPDEYVERLKQVFTTYCPVSVGCSKSKMPLYTYLSLLKDCGVVGGESGKGKISTTEAELLFVKSVRYLSEKENSSIKSPSSNLKKDEVKQNKVDFNGFYLLLTQIAEKLYPSSTPNRPFETLFNERLMHLPIKESADPRVLLDNEETLKILRILKKSLSAYLEFYLDKGKRMSFDSFVKFCKDFGAFPEIANKHMLQSLFCTFTFNSAKDSKSKNSLNENEVIEALGICAIKSPAFSNSSDPVRKIIRLAEKMSRSSGIAKIKRTTGATRIAADNPHFLREIKAKYKEHFGKKAKSAEKQLVSKILMDSN